jgi:hypothetical protein
MTSKPYKHALGTIEILEGANYATWKRQCARVLKGIKAWNIVLGEEQPPNNPVGYNAAAVAERAVYDGYMTRRDQASAIISGSCCNEVQIQIEDIDDPAEMWTMIATKRDATSTIVGRMTLLRKFHALRPVAGESIATYFSRLKEIKNQLLGTDEAISNAEFKTHVFTTLPTMFDVIVIILQARADATLQEIEDALKEHEQNQAMIVKPDAVSDALYSHQGGRNDSQRGRGGRGGRNNKGKERGPQKWCDSCKLRSHNTVDCWHTEKNNNKKRPQEHASVCYYCAEEGHTKGDCPIRKKAYVLRNSRAAQEQEGNREAGNGPAPNATGNQQ